MKDDKLYVENPLYRFFTNKICELDIEIRGNKMKLNVLANKQKELKVGRKELVSLRRELVSSLKK